MPKARLAFALVAATYAAVLQAHGEDKPGPHGGYVRMPGALHTELVPEDGAVKVYLLDLGFENPTVKESAVSAELVVDGKAQPLVCAAGADAFVCKLPDGAALTKGALKLTAKRGAAAGAPVTYELPLTRPAH